MHAIPTRCTIRGTIPNLTYRARGERSIALSDERLLWIDAARARGITRGLGVQAHERVGRRRAEACANWIVHIWGVGRCGLGSGHA